MNNLRTIILVIAFASVFYWRAPGALSAQASFPHGSPKHRTIACSKCHVVTPAKQDVREFPGHAGCDSCHKFVEEAANAQRFCGICHMSLPESPTNLNLFRFPKPRVQTEFGIQFPHASHQQARLPESSTALKCLDCHSVIRQARFPGDKSETPEIVIEMAHQNCFRCHSTKPAKGPAMTNCAGCHGLNAPGSPELFNTIRTFRHYDHFFDIRSKKKAELQDGKKFDLCAECHISVVRSTSLKDIRLPNAAFCVECHTSKIGFPKKLTEEVMSILSKAP